MERSWTKLKDVDQQILLEMDDETLLNYCKSHKYGSRLCDDDLFWKKRVIRRFGSVQKGENRTWKNLYLNLIYYAITYHNKNDALYQISTKGIKNIDLINFYLLRGADINEGLIGASQGGDKNLVEYYISRGANDFINGFLTSKQFGNNHLLKIFREHGLRVFGM